MVSPRILFSTGSLYLYDLSYCFQLAAEAGFDGIEVMCDERYSSRDPFYLEKLGRHYNLHLPVFHMPFSPRVPGWPSDEIGRIYRTLDLAARLNGETIVVHVPRKLGWGQLQFNAKRIYFPWRSPFMGVKTWVEQDLPRVQERAPVKIALENMPIRRLWGVAFDPTWWNEPDTWGSVHSWLTLDTTHWATKGVDPLDAYEAADGRVCHVHLSNFDGREHRLPHKGRLDLGRFLRALSADGYKGTISLELDPQPLQFQDDEAMRRNLRDSLAFCREHLG